MPSLSDASILMVCEPSDSAEDGVYVHSYPPVIAFLVMASPVTLEPESIVIPMVDGLTPESSSFTVNVIVGLLLII